MPLNYLNQYKDYKYNYIQLKLFLQKAGDYEFDENKIRNIPSSTLREEVFDIKNYDYIAGPVSIYFIVNKEFNKRILLFGDHHIYNEKFKCGINDDTKTIYVTRLCNTLFKKNSNEKSKKIFDVFTETPFYMVPEEKVNYETNSGLLSAFRYTYDICFEGRTQKIECNMQIPNVRFHYMDIRYYLRITTIGKLEEEDYDDLIILTSGINTFNYMVKINNDPEIENEINDTLIKMNAIIKQIVENSTDLQNKINVDILPKNLPLIRTRTLKEAVLKVTEKRDGIIRQYVEIIKIISNSEHKDKYKESIDELDFLVNYDLTYTLRNWMPFYLDTKYRNFIKKYLADENGIYSDEQILKNAFKLCDIVPRLKRNIGENREILEQNYKMLDMFKNIRDYNDIIKNLMGRIDFIISHVSIPIILEKLFSEFGIIIMDIYLLSRTLKKFIPKTEKDIQQKDIQQEENLPEVKKNIEQEYANDIIIIAGHLHIKNYVEFYKKIGGEELFSDVNDERCVKNPSDKLKDYYNI